MVMTRLLGELVASGSRIAATSNTPPNALGEGRFAAADFLREIHSMAANFDIMRIDGLDYRRRHIEGHAASVPPGEVAAPSARPAAGPPGPPPRRCRRAGGRPGPPSSPARGSGRSTGTARSSPTWRR